MESLRSLFGILALLALGWILSENRKRISLRTLGGGLLLQVGIAVLLLKLPVSREVFLALNRLVLAVEASTRAGTAFVFGYVGGGETPFEVTSASSTFVLAFQALPIALVISAVSSVLYYWRILPRVVQAFSRVLQRTLGIGGAEGVGVSANVFMGMVESPLLIRPYLAGLSRSELFTVMTCGMATIAGTVMVLYASLLGDHIPGALGHILTASLINAPAAVVISKLLVPESQPVTGGEVVIAEEGHSFMDALTTGTLRGVQLLINISAMLIVMVALVHLVNLSLGLLPGWGGSPVTLEGLLGWCLAPVTWLLGVPWPEAPAAGALLGTKTVLNELIAYVRMGQLPEGVLSPRSTLIMIYAMCGFANPGSLGIMIGGMGTMVPERRQEVVELGPKSILAGSLATCLSGALVGALTW